jgi:phosphatidylinositol alpha-mannosyltransferase
MTSMLLHPAPVVATFHAAGDSPSYRYGNAPMKAAAKNIARRVAVSKDALALVEEHVPGHYEVLYNGVELDSYRAATPFPTEGPTIFFCGRHEERKGLDVLLAAMTELGPEVTLWVASSGPDTERLRQQTGADPRIKWLGRISDEEKISRLRGADVFCAPSLHGESFGVVLIEAMAAGTCIVASALDGYRNVATDDVDSLLVAPGDVAALAAAIKRVLHDPALDARLVAAGSTRADDFSMAALARHYLAMYHEVAPPPSRTRRPMSPWPFMSGPVSPRRRRRTRMMAP